jgi:hypothetical protein
LSVLALSPGKLLTGRALLGEVLGLVYGREPYLPHQYVSRLRQKIEPDRARPRFLLTVHAPATGWSHSILVGSRSQDSCPSATGLDAVLAVGRARARDSVEIGSKTVETPD